VDFFLLQGQDRLSAHAPSRTTSVPCVPIPCQFQLSGRNLDQAAEGYHQGRVASRRTLFPRRLHRHEHEPPGDATSCRTFAANAVRFQLHPLACNLGNFLRTLATPEPIKDWLLTSLKDKLIKIGAKVVSYGRYVIFQMAEVAIAWMFQEILRLTAELRLLPPSAPAETSDLHASTATNGRSASECHAKWPDRPSNAMQEPAVPEVALISGRDF
jgi:hypothetical protein